MICGDCCIRGPRPRTHQHYTYWDILDSVTVTGDSGALATFKDDLGPDKVQVEILDGAVRVSGIHPADLHWVLSLVKRWGLGVALERRRRLVHGGSRARGAGCISPGFVHHDEALPRGLTHRLWHQAIRPGSFRWWGAISASQCTWP